MSQRQEGHSPASGRVGRSEEEQDWVEVGGHGKASSSSALAVLPCRVDTAWEVGGGAWGSGTRALAEDAQQSLADRTGAQWAQCGPFGKPS